MLALDLPDAISCLWSVHLGEYEGGSTDPTFRLRVLHTPDHRREIVSAT